MNFHYFLPPRDLFVRLFNLILISFLSCLAILLLIKSYVEILNFGKIIPVVSGFLDLNMCFFAIVYTEISKVSQETVGAKDVESSY